MRFHFNCHASPVNCFNLDRGTVPTNVGGQQIVHRDIPRKRGGYVTSSPKFGSHKMLTNLPDGAKCGTGWSV